MSRFNVLDDEVSLKAPSASIEEAISYAVATATGTGGKVCKEKSTGKEKLTGLEKPTGKEKLAGSQKPTGKEMLSEDVMQEVIMKVLVAIQPVIIQAITEAVKVAVTTAMQQLKPPCIPSSPLQQQKLENDIERLEQYGRRENVRVYGVPETAGEDTTEKVVALARRIDVNVSTADISVSHRLPSSKRRGPSQPERHRPIIVKFVRREQKVQLLRNKRRLREQDQLRGIYIEEDLTAQRAKLFHAIRRAEGTKKVWTIDGRIHCVIAKNGKEEKKVVIDSPQDLARLGWADDRIRKFIAA